MLGMPHESAAPRILSPPRCFPLFRREPNSRVWAFTGPYTAPGSASGAVA